MTGERWKGPLVRRKQRERRREETDREMEMKER